jgi:hypothetical protein
MLRQTLDRGQIEEAELLYRIYIFATNSVDVGLLWKQGKNFENWKDLEHRMAQYRKAYQRRVLKLIK